MSPFKYCPICGADQFAPRSSNLLVCAKCDYYYHINPVVAVAAFLPDPTGRILLVRRASEPAKGKLGAPGGFVDIGETGETALRREIKEEVNLELASLEYLCSYPNEYPYRGRTIHVLDLFYVGKVASWVNAAALSEVDSLVRIDPKTINPSELAFKSLVKALEDYLRRK